MVLGVMLKVPSGKLTLNEAIKRWFQGNSNIIVLDQVHRINDT